MSKDDNSNIVNVMTTMNIRSKQQPQIMIMIKKNQTLIMNIMTTMKMKDKSNINYEHYDHYEHYEQAATSECPRDRRPTKLRNLR